MSATSEQRLIEVIRENRWNELILARAARLGFEDWWLTAGCIAQSVWNHASGRDIHAGIRDYDLFYYDEDTSWQAENEVIARAAHPISPGSAGRGPGAQSGQSAAVEIETRVRHSVRRG